MRSGVCASGALDVRGPRSVQAMNAPCSQRPLPPPGLYARAPGITVHSGLVVAFEEQVTAVRWRNRGQVGEYCHQGLLQRSVLRQYTDPNSAAEVHGYL